MQVLSILRLVRYSMRVAFLILNHREPTQLLRLAKTLRLELPDAPIVVHNDKFRTHLDASALDSVGNAYLLTSERPIRWGDFSLVEAYWRSMEWILEHLEFDWLVLLSAQDYPIKPLTKLGEDLAATDADALILATPISKLSSRTERRNRRRRYLYQYRTSVVNGQPGSAPYKVRRWLRRHTGLLVDILNNVQPCFQVYKYADQIPWRVGLRARQTPFSQNEPCWFGSVWITLSHRAAKLVVDSAKQRPDYVDYYRRTAHPDESATATLICNAPGLRTEGRDLHHARWTDSASGHPDTFSADDLPELLEAPEYFARKFDIAKYPDVLDMLDAVLARERSAVKHVAPEGPEYLGFA